MSYGESVSNETIRAETGTGFRFDTLGCPQGAGRGLLTFIKNYAGCQRLPVKRLGGRSSANLPGQPVNLTLQLGYCLCELRSWPLAIPALKKAELHLITLHYPTQALRSIPERLEFPPSCISLQNTFL